MNNISDVVIDFNDVMLHLRLEHGPLFVGRKISVLDHSYPIVFNQILILI